MWAETDLHALSQWIPLIMTKIHLAIWLSESFSCDEGLHGTFSVNQWCVWILDIFIALVYVTIFRMFVKFKHNKEVYTFLCIHFENDFDIK